MKRLAQIRRPLMLALLAVIMTTATGCHWSHHRHHHRDHDRYYRR